MFLRQKLTKEEMYRKAVNIQQRMTMEYDEGLIDAITAELEELQNAEKNISHMGVG